MTDVSATTVLTEAGVAFMRRYYGTPETCLHAGDGSYLKDFNNTPRRGVDDAAVEDNWRNYDRLVPGRDRRYA